LARVRVRDRCRRGNRGSIALIAFGADSLIEALAGFVILWRFAASRAESEAAERRAQQLIAASYFVLVVYIVVESSRTFFGSTHPSTSWVGIALAAFTAVTMPMLAIAKRRVGVRLGSSATVSEGRQSMICAYLSVALLVGFAREGDRRMVVGRPHGCAGYRGDRRTRRHGGVARRLVLRQLLTSDHPRARSPAPVFRNDPRALRGQLAFGT
jgi:hypothetical protein